MPDEASAFSSFLQWMRRAFSALFGLVSTQETVFVNNRRFVVIRQLGSGASGFVCVVRVDGAEYALKRVRIQLPEHAKMLDNELRSHRCIDHPNVIRLVDSQIISSGGSVVEGRLLLPLFRKGSVQELIDNSSEFLPLHTVLRIAIDVCRGLSAFHSSIPSLAFRDLKPANILLDENGTAVLADLGSVAPARVTITTRREAVALQDHCAETVTAPFRAPELFDPPSNTIITEATDVWALGCTIYNIAYKAPPFDGSMTAAVSGRPSFPQADPYGTQLRTIIQGILQPNPGDRPNVAQIEQLLVRFLGSVTVDV